MRSTDAMYEIIYSANMHINHNLAQAVGVSRGYTDHHQGRGHP